MSSGKKQTVVSRGWCGTLNNPKISPKSWFDVLLAQGKVVYACGQIEKGANRGTEHLQYYVVVAENPRNKNGRTLKWMKDNICDATHWEKREGTHEQARDYCTLEEYNGVNKGRLNGPWVVGEWAGTAAGSAISGAKHSSKILELKEMILDGANDRDLWEHDTSSMLRYSNGFDRYRLAIGDQVRTQRTKALWIYGEPGTGKSFEARKIAEQICGGLHNVYFKDSSKWWDNYMGQEVVVWEEYYGGCMRISEALKLLDESPLSVEKKGSTVNFSSRWVIFTSNNHYKECYTFEAQPGEDARARAEAGNSHIPKVVWEAWCSRFEGKRGHSIHKTEVYVAPAAEAEPDACDELYFELDEAQRIAQEAEADAVPEEVIDLTGDEDSLEFRNREYMQDEADSGWLSRGGGEIDDEAEEGEEPDFSDGQGGDYDDDEDVDDKEHEWSPTELDEMAALNEWRATGRTGAQSPPSAAQPVHSPITRSPNPAVTPAGPAGHLRKRSLTFVKPAQEGYVAGEGEFHRESSPDAECDSCVYCKRFPEDRAAHIAAKRRKSVLAQVRAGTQTILSTKK